MSDQPGSSPGVGSDPEQRSSGRQPPSRMGMAMAVGVGIGTGIGAGTGQLAVGVALGAALGAAVGAALDRRGSPASGQTSGSPDEA